ncbi:MAG: hypothetical protein EOO28_25930 [Comamonadaceae bacterium]|nr:MAG: hypothetical protein EOO28_25930 [Comamonadaceae bacterium]
MLKTGVNETTASRISRHGLSGDELAPQEWMICRRLQLELKRYASSDGVAILRHQRQHSQCQHDLRHLTCVKILFQYEAFFICQTTRFAKDERQTFPAQASRMKHD